MNKLPIPRLERQLTGYKWNYADEQLKDKPIGSRLLVSSLALPINKPEKIHNHWLIKTKNGNIQKYESIII